MADLQKMPPIQVTEAELLPFGNKWQELGERLSRTPPYSSGQLGELFDAHVGKALANFLGNIPVIRPSPNDLLPREVDAVEVGPARIVGGVRPQNFDVAYRPDGVRFAFDSKTLNDAKSIGKNYQNMINDLATEATTVHTRFPYAIVAFMVIVPEPALLQTQEAALVRTLERLTNRSGTDEPHHLAEVIAFVVWHPDSGTIDTRVPSADSPLRLEKFSSQVEQRYVERYKGLPPHD